MIQGSEGSGLLDVGKLDALQQEVVIELKLSWLGRGLLSSLHFNVRGLNGYNQLGCFFFLILCSLSHDSREVPLEAGTLLRLGKVVLERNINRIACFASIVPLTKGSDTLTAASLSS